MDNSFYYDDIIVGVAINIWIIETKRIKKLYLLFFVFNPRCKDITILVKLQSIR